MDSGSCSVHSLAYIKEKCLSYLHVFADWFFIWLIILIDFLIDYFFIKHLNDFQNM